MTSCNHLRCPGSLAATGFCDTCGRRPPPEPATAGEAGPPDEWSPGRGRIGLPVYTLPDPVDRVLSDPEFPELSRFCGGCRSKVGRGYKNQPGQTKGFCPTCGEPFSFRPKLAKGDVVAGRYTIEGCLAHGGFGWVYLGRDGHLEGSPVVLKGLINSADKQAVELAVNERRSLQRLDHPSIVRIFDAVTHPDPGSEELAGYIVMAYVDGLSLREIIDTDERMPLGEPLVVEHVVICGLEILAALAYLHGRGLLYCDMKPDNVMVTQGDNEHAGNRIKLVDLGGVRRMGDDTAPIVSTLGYGPPEKPTVRYDICTVGRTLQELDRAAPFGRLAAQSGDSGLSDAASIGLISFRRLVERAIRPDPDRRFGSATEMAEQLRGVQRELESLRTGAENPMPSTVFAPTAFLLDAGLGTVPELDRWTGDGRAGADERTRPLAVGRPTSAMVAIGLPSPRVDSADPAAGLLAQTSAPDARRLIDKLAGYREQVGRSPAIEWRACHAWLELADLERADKCLSRAGEMLGGTAANEWRMAWYQGLVALANSQLDTAETKFQSVYKVLPGELAPKLALAYCFELLGDDRRAERYFEAVWRRDRLQASAAFGLARIRLSRPDRAGAVRILDEVPEVSRHCDAARIAAVRVSCGRLSTGSAGDDGLPTAADFAEAEHRLPVLYLDGHSRTRLNASLMEAALDWVSAAGSRPPTPGVNVFGAAADERSVRIELQNSFRHLAWQARIADDHGVLVDLANAIRPETRW